MAQMPNDLPVKRFPTQAAWRAWLARNHETAPGVWMEVAKKGSGLRSVTREEALEVALSYGWIDSLLRSVDERYYRQKYTPRGPRSKWSKINCAAVERLHAAGKLAPAGLQEMERAKADGRWEAAYDSPRTMAVPDDLLAALKENPRARRFWEQLDGQNRFAILFRLHDAKRAETRERRLAKFIAMLEAGEKIHER